MAAIIGGKEKTFNLYGNDTIVPKNDIAILSYYLNCVNGLIAGQGARIPKDLVDYKNLKWLRQAKKDAIITLCLLFHPMELLNKLFLVDNNHVLLPKDKSNYFCELKEVTHLVALSSSAVIGGQETKIAKVMLCHTDWLERNWLTPMRKLSRRAAQISKNTIRDMNKMFDMVETGIALHQLSDALEQLTTGDDSDKEEEKVVSKHCDHCKGLQGVCACRKGCDPKSGSACSDHPTTTCDWCEKESFRGTRFKCRECFNYDLCHSCYLKEDDSHLQCRFTAITKDGDDPIALPPRQKKPPATPPTPPTPAAVPVFATATMDGPAHASAKAEPTPSYATYVNPPPTAPIAEAIRVSGFEADQWVRVVGMGDHMNGRCGVIVRAVPGNDDKYLVSLSGGANEKMVFQGKNLEVMTSSDPNYPLNAFVQINGLVSASGVFDNEKYGVIAGYATANGRVSVKLFDEDRIVSVKKENVTVFADAK